MTFTYQLEREDDGRWLAEIVELPGCMACGATSQAADWISSDSSARWLAGLRFAFHDRHEIGPRMLARIAKHTGLRPDDR